MLGIMSGSSLDGIDLALCAFTRWNERWHWELVQAQTTPYPSAWVDRLLHLGKGSALDLARAHTGLGGFIGEHAAQFLQAHGGANLIASHGHTIFHQPTDGFTTQIGCGARIAAATELPTVVDFRSKDVALGGQGAPLVPIGERDLFNGYDAFLNLGGIANVSFHGERVLGFDICICNQALNHLAAEAGGAFDADGAIARAGKVDPGLFQRLCAQPFLQLDVPRAMGREHFDEQCRPLIEDRSIALPDRMRTLVEQIAHSIGEALQKHGAVKTLVTGGGAHNTFLLDRIRSNFKGKIERPSPPTVDFKEAVIFAYLGLLRWRGEVNALATVTGASRDSIGGAVFLPN